MRTKIYLGKRIKKYRKSCNLTQDELAKVMGMARTTIVAIEQDKRAVVESEISAFEAALFMDKGSLNKEEVTHIKPTAVHLYFGYNVGKREKGEKCFYCGAKPPQMFYTYFGAPLCADCWDNDWRTTDEGKTDPPSSEIKNRQSGVWL